MISLWGNEPIKPVPISRTFWRKIQRWNFTLRALGSRGSSRQNKISLKFVKVFVRKLKKALQTVVWCACGGLESRKQFNRIFARRAYCVGETSKSMCVRPCVRRPSVRPNRVRTWLGRRKWSYQVQIVNFRVQKYHFEPVFGQFFRIWDFGGQRVIHVVWRSWRILENFKLFRWTFPFGRPCPAGPI